MPISGLDPAAIGTLRQAEIVAFALDADRERRRLIREGDLAGACAAMRERNALAELSRK